jgi:acetoacetyl-CoA synthetase
MAIESYRPSGTPCEPGEPGELVCLKPFPCMPVGFWPLDGFGTPDAVMQAKERYQQSYFSHFKGIWCKSASLQLSEDRH